MSNKLRILSLLNFIFQALRIPVAIYLASSHRDLDVYFLIVGASIPAQFFASEVMLYRGISLKALSFGEILSLGTILLSFLYMHIQYGFYVGFYYTVYSMSILALSFYSKRLRTIYGANIFIAADALQNFLLTVAVVLVCFYFNGRYLSFAIIIATVLLAATYSIIIHQVTMQGDLHPETHMHAPTRGSSYYYQLGIMISTQLERVLVGAIWPLFLGGISMAAAICQGWRRFVLDDAVLYERIKSAEEQASVSVTAFFYYFKHSLIFLSCVFLFAYLQGLHLPFPFHPFAKLFRNSVIDFLVPLLIIYVAALPSGIVGVNLIRGGWFSPSFSFMYLALVICILFGFLVGINLYNTALGHNYIWAFITITAGINIFLFLDFLRSTQKINLKTVGSTVMFYLVICGIVFAVIL